MYIPFASLPPHARVWIYQSDKKFTEEQKNIISQALNTFTDQWLVHGMPMDASFDIRFNQFIILAANDQASGCSIDSSVRTIKSLGDTLNLNFFDRNLIAFKKGEEINLISLNNLKASWNDQHWNGESLMFNNLVNTKKDLEDNWIVKATNTWLKRYMPQQTIIH